MKFPTPTRAACSLTLALLLLVATSLVAEQLRPTSSQTPVIVRQVCTMIESQHLNQQHINDSTSAKLVKQFVRDLDPLKLYFLQADIDQFHAFQDKLDDAVKAGNVDFAYATFNTYLQRLDQRIEHAHQLIDAPHDFTVDERMEIDAKEFPWAADSKALDERWRKRIKHDFLVLKLDKTSDDEIRKRLHKRYKNIKETMHGTEEIEVLEMYLTALCNTFDPHSAYMAPRSEKEFRIQMNLSLDGIGAALRTEDGYTIVASIVRGGPANKDGRLKVNDKIIGVSNEKGEISDVVDTKLSKVVDQIRGKRGTVVKLQVITAATGETKVYDITRDKVELTMQEVKGEIIQTAPRLKGINNTPHRVGVIHIPSFYRDFGGADSGEENFKSTSRDVKKVLRDFAAKGGVHAVVIDLRFNGGGALQEAIEVSGLFIDSGPVVQVKNQRNKVKELDDEEAGVDYNGPVIVLTNRLSASASEIFAGVIKDYHRGLVVGDRTTHGKGTVQSVAQVSGGSSVLNRLLNPPDQGAVKLTINQFYRVNGDSTQVRGVPSDITLPSFLDNMDLGEAFLDNAMEFDQVPPAAHAMLRSVNADLIALLADRSKKRVTANTDFQKTMADIEKFLARKKRKSVSLNEEELKKERIDDEQKTKDKLDEDEYGDREIYPDNAYNNEVLAIAVDYLERLQEVNTAKK